MSLLPADFSPYTIKMHERIVILLHKSISDTGLDSAEKKELEDWIAVSPHNRSVFEEINNRKKLEQEIKEMLSNEAGFLWNKITW